MRNFVLTLKLALLALVCTAFTAAHAAIDVFICFDGGGEAAIITPETVDKYINVNSPVKGAYCNVLNTAFGMGREVVNEQPTAKSAFKPIVIEMQAGAAVNKLFLAAAKGQSYNKVTLAYRKAGGSTKTLKPYFLVEMNTVYISSVEFVQSGDEPMSARITLVPASMTLSLWKQKSDGTITGSPAVVTWNQETNAKQ
jgi:type VI protein secretion system component Hcp